MNAIQVDNLSAREMHLENHRERISNLCENCMLEVIPQVILRNYGDDLPLPQECQ